MIISFLKKNLEKEYDNIFLFCFPVFLFGIIFFFNYFPNFFSFLVIFVFSLLVRSVFSDKIIILFFCSLITSFSLGVLISAFKFYNIKAKPIKKNIDNIILIGKINNIKPNNNGKELIINYIDNSQIKNLKKVKIYITNKNLEDLNLNIGDKIKFEVRLKPPNLNLLPGSFDHSFYMYMSSIQAIGYKVRNIELVEKYNSNFNNNIQNLRQIIYKRLLSVLGDKKGNFVAALLIGETKAIDNKIVENMRNSGISHILSVSGLHLSLVAAIFFVSSRVLLNLSNYLAYNFNIKSIAAAISILGSFLYLKISGGNIAATRAFFMTSIFLVSIIIGRMVYPMRSVMIAGFIILLFLPEYVFHPSFQLSFSAVLCLISSYEIYRNSKFSDYMHYNGFFSKIKMFIFTNIYSSFSASIITAPFVIYHFYKFANYSVLMNLIAVPIMSFFIMPLLLLSTILMPIRLDHYILKLVGLFVNLIINSSDYIVKLPHAVLHVGNISLYILILFSIGFFLFCILQTSLRLIGLGLMIIAFCAIIFSEKPNFVYDRKKNILLISDGKNLNIYTSRKLSKFKYNKWLDWYGYKEANIDNKRMKDKNSLFYLQYNKTLSINRTKCIEADFMIVTYKNLNCKSKKYYKNPVIYDYNFFSNNRYLQIFFNQ